MESARKARRIHSVRKNIHLYATFSTQSKSFPDKLRGVLNEGGLFGERAGWHLPGFSTARWPTRFPSQGLPNGPGVGFFVTTFDLNVPAGVDAMFSFEFTDVTEQQYRALLFVNGWQYGKVWFLWLQSSLTWAY